MGLVATSCIMLGYATVGVMLVEFFGTSQLVVNMNVFIFSIMFIPTNFVAIRIYSSKGGLRYSVSF